MIDNHVHVGWFLDGYHSPKEVWDAECQANIDELVVSSTSTCAELYKLVVREMRELIRLGGSRIHPILWLTPRMFTRNHYAIPYLLKKISWQGVKLHSEAHPQWNNNPHLVRKAISIARKLNVPVLLHTGERKTCNAIRFLSLIKSNQDLIFILAHGRPVDETILCLQECPNCYVDTAFMPVENLSILIENGFADRVLFGSDAPINRTYFSTINTDIFIKQHLEEFLSFRIPNKIIYETPQKSKNSFNPCKISLQ